MFERISTGVTSLTFKNRFNRHSTVNTKEILASGKYFFTILRRLFKHKNKNLFIHLSSKYVGYQLSANILRNCSSTYLLDKCINQFLSKINNLCNITNAKQKLGHVVSLPFYGVFMLKYRNSLRKIVFLYVCFVLHVYCL